MAISDRITSIEEHIKESYQELEGIGIDTTGVNNNLENIPKLLDGYWETLPKVTGEGTSITLDNTKEGKMKINLKGNTSQETTTGKNKLNVESSYSITTQDTKTINIPAGTYTLSCTNLTTNTETNACLIQLTGDTTQQVYMYYNDKKVTFTTTETKTGIKMYSGTTYANSEGKTTSFTNLMLETGSTATSYEPYTNGASPNPDYPQDIHVVSGNNSIDVCGKNLFNDSVKNNTWISANGTISTSATGSNLMKVKCSAGDTYTLSGTFATASGSGVLLIAFFDSNNTMLSRTATGGQTTITKIATAPNNTAYMYAGHYTEQPLTIQLEKGNEATTYEEYKGASYPISLGDIELCKIGDYQDSIKKSTGKNLFDKDNVENDKRLDASGQLISSDATGFSTTGYIKVKPNTKYTYSRNTTSSSYYVNICEYTSDKTHIRRLYSAGNTTTKYVFTTPSNCEYLRINDATTNLGTIQLEEGDITTPVYEPYGTGWYLNKQIRKVILDGTENWETGTYGTNSYKLPAYPYGYMIEEPNKIDIITNLFKGVAFVNRTTSGDNIIYNDSSYFYIRNTSYTSLANFKTMLGTNNMTLYYILATPTYTEITDSTLLSQLNALAKSYTGQTNISQENNDLASILNATALEEME